MKMVKYLISTAILMGAISCVDFDTEEEKKFQDLKDIKNTVWHNEDKANRIYYSINYSDVESSDVAKWYDGTMVGYSDAERTNKLESTTRNFIYIFTPATREERAIVLAKFDDGTKYDGYLIPKGHIPSPATGKEAYIIQLLMIGEDDKPVMNDKNEYESPIMMWME